MSFQILNICLLVRIVIHLLAQKNFRNQNHNLIFNNNFRTSLTTTKQPQLKKGHFQPDKSNSSPAQNMR